MLSSRYLRLDDDLVPFLESGCALVIGSVSADGAPFAARGWGLDVLDPAAGRIRLLVAAADLPSLGPAIAVTGASVRTLRSVQLKGTVEVVEERADAADEERSARYRDDFFGTVADADGTPRATLDRLQPGALAALRIAVDELYDQTPGPGAGAALRA